MQLPSNAPKLIFAAIALPACAAVAGVLRIADVSPTASLWASTSLLVAGFVVFALKDWHSQTARPERRAPESVGEAAQYKSTEKRRIRTAV
jgi:hypothetical protein